MHYRVLLLLLLSSSRLIVKRIFGHWVMFVPICTAVFLTRCCHRYKRRQTWRFQFLCTCFAPRTGAPAPRPARMRWRRGPQ